MTFEKPKRGFLLGKFMPPHAGHQYLCDFASAYAESLTILVCSLAREPINGQLRFNWISELYPAARVLHLTDDIPQAPEDHPDFWPIWREVIRRLHPEPIDAVFASEPYGLQLAKELGADFVPVDPDRLAFPISGTAIREDPYANWRYLPAPVRAHFARRVCLFGPESTGKTTLAGRLAERFDTVCAPEFGRTYTDVFGTECSPDDLSRIAAGQTAAIAAAARAANRLLITDTDAVLTAVWSDMLTGQRPPELAGSLPLCDLYLLCDIDALWVDDGTRYFPGDQVRRDLMEQCVAELRARDAHWQRLSGGWPERETAAVQAISDAFPELELGHESSQTD